MARAKIRASGAWVTITDEDHRSDSGDPHPQYASGFSGDHADLTNVTADQHHAETHDVGVDGPHSGFLGDADVFLNGQGLFTAPPSGVTDHDDLTNVTATQHHTNANDPSAGEKAALAGTSGTPGSGNKYVTDGDARNTNARTPSAHATSHNAGGSDVLAIDAAAATGSLRTLGTGAAQAAAGNDSRLTDSRAPSGAAGGDLTGTYPNPTVDAGKVTLAKMADLATAKLIGRATAGTGVPEAIDLSAAGRALIDDADAAAQRTTLGLSDIPWTVVVKAADESVSSSTTPQNDDHLFFATVNGGAYEWELFLIYASPAGGSTPDLKIALGETNWGAAMMAGIATGDTLNGSGFLTNASQTLSYGTAFGGGNRTLIGRGSYVASGATFRLLWAQNTSDANPTTVRAKSVLRYRRIDA